MEGFIQRLFTEEESRNSASEDDEDVDEEKMMIFLHRIRIHWSGPCTPIRAQERLPAAEKSIAEEILTAVAPRLEYCRICHSSSLHNKGKIFGICTP